MIISAFLPVTTCGLWQWHNMTPSWVAHWFHCQQNTHPYAHACFVSYLNFKHVVFADFIWCSSILWLSKWWVSSSSIDVHLCFICCCSNWCLQDTCMTLRESLVFWWWCLSLLHSVMTAPQLVFWLFEFLLKIKNIMNS
jgi:hypothetical protein